MQQTSSLGIGIPWDSWFLPGCATTYSGAIKALALLFDSSLCLSGPSSKVTLYSGTGLFFLVKRTRSWLDLSAVMVITSQEAYFLAAFANKVCQRQILCANFLVPRVLPSL